VKRTITAYTIDLVSVLINTFGLTLPFRFSGTIDWEVLKDAFQQHETSGSHRRIHDTCRLAMAEGGKKVFDREGFTREVEALLNDAKESLGT
jgi:hypothetical protein